MKWPALLRGTATRRLFAPEVVQTSTMDCGPAALTCLLEGFGIPVSYARLQEACQTDLDGTSINTIERVAVMLGLDAEQVMIPADHLFLSAAHPLPAMLVVRQENMTHFVVAWRRFGPFLQLMDPAKGRRWLTKKALLNELYLHAHSVPTDDWREWAGTAEFQESLIERLDRLRVSRQVSIRLLKTATADASWLALASLDATIRMATELAQAKGVRRGRNAADVVDRVATCVLARTAPAHQLVPLNYWSVLPDAADTSGKHLLFLGAVLLRVRSRHAFVPASAVASAAKSSDQLPQNLTRALTESKRRPLAEIWQLLRGDGVLAPALLVGASIVAAGATLFEMLLFRGFLDIGDLLSLREHRLVATAVLLFFGVAILLLETATTNGVLGIGRRLEARLRMALLEKLPRLGDRYFQSRLVSDMAHRAHSLHALRALPDLGARLVRTSLQLVFTAMGLAWLDPPNAWLAVMAATLALLIPLTTQKMLAERELRQRNHAAALSRYYLDSLLGLVAAKTHGAERALRRGHEALLTEWGRASLHLLRGSVVVEGLQLLAGFSLAAWLVLDFVQRGGRPGSSLLLVYWALSLPMLGREVAVMLRLYPMFRNVLMRLLEPLRAPDETGVTADAAHETTHAHAGSLGHAAQEGVALAFNSVTVQVAEHPVLNGIDLTIRSGEHVAIVGRSGAGKSTLVGMLLGWNPPTTGNVLVDGARLDGASLAELRRSIAWVDPGIQLWNRSLFENLRYGDSESLVPNLGPVLDTAQLTEILETLPGGLQASLGEGGRLTSGGEGQRVRFGRALLARGVRLALLDEPFRGVDRQRRRELLARARDVWRGATLLCVTHDIEETLTFERVLVLEGGRIVEDASPALLARAQGSTYAALLAAERAVRSELWSGARWRRWRLEDGTIQENSSPAEHTWSIHHSSRGL